MTIERDEFLAHYGVLGMKWGKRKGGLSARVKGAALDENQRRSAVAKRAATGRSTLEEKIVNAPARVILGKQRYEKMANTRVSYLKAQKQRVKIGKPTLDDYIELSYGINLVDLTVSRRDNKG